jgi:long-subunit acyl-CoA synthetase (AMP-forming)
MSASNAAASDVAYLLYTSGTTGKPKGVELTHRNALSQQASIAAVWDVGERDVFLSYLPWHHCFGALFERLMALWHRALLVIDDSRGRDLDRLYTNFFDARPTIYFGVPRVYNGMIARARSDPKALAALQSLRFAFSAAAPIAEPAFRFFEELGVPVLEGWGLTETSPCATITRRSDANRAPGVVGFPLPGTSVKLDPVPEFPGRGEILVRGPQVMRGYHRRPEDTARVLSDGWLRSGDLGEWTPHGLKLLGRIDGVFKLENGEKVSAGEVELRILASTPLLEQAVVLGPSQPFVTALCWIAPAAAQRFLQDYGVEPPASVAELAQVPQLRRAIVEALQSGNLLAGCSYERVRRIALVSESPSLETGELTPTMKMVRSVSQQRHAQLIAALRDRRPHASTLDIFCHGDAFQNA